MSQEYIEIRGARENNLKNVSLRIPKRKITIFTGVSGSGKSSIVFDTIATEAQRQLNETFSMFVRNFLPRYPQPDADAIENLSMAIVVDQKRLGGGSHSTVGTITDIYTVLRLLFSRVGQPYRGPLQSPFRSTIRRACARSATAWAARSAWIWTTFLDTSKSLNEGAILFPEYAVDSWGWTILSQSGLFDKDKKLADYTRRRDGPAAVQQTAKGQDEVSAARSVNLTFEGIIDKFTRKYITRDLKTCPSARRKRWRRT